MLRIPCIRNKIARFKEVYEYLRKINPDDAPELQDKKITSISLKFAICWEDIMKLIDMEVIYYNDEHSSLMICPDIKYKKSSDFQT